MSMDDLRHPECRYCAEYERVTRGLVVERDQARRQLREAGRPVRVDGHHATAVLLEASGQAFRDRLERNPALNTPPLHSSHDAGDLLTALSEQGFGIYRLPEGDR